MREAVIRDDSTIGRAPARRRPALPFGGFVTLMAALMAMNALAIDTMLPALPAMASSLGLASITQAQLIISVYVAGLGAGQLFYGVLSDRFGRRPVLLAGIGVYVVFSLAAAAAPSMELMLLARFAQGAGASATRVLTVSIVRDQYAGRQMARVMSLVFIVFMAIPIMAPALGQAVVSVAPWPVIFLVLALFGAALFAVVWLRLPESLHPQDRLPLSPQRIFQAFGEVLSNRLSLGYMIGSTLMLSMMFGFVNSAAQIFTQVYPLGGLFPLAFAGIGVFLASASLLNSRIVERLGSRRVSHSALLAMIVLAAIHLLLAALGHDTVLSFLALLSVTLFCFGLVGPNFNAMAMDPMGHIAGTASSVQGFVTTIGAAALGTVIGQSFDGTTMPLLIGFLALGVCALATVLVTERGRLFTSHRPPGAAD